MSRQKRGHDVFKFVYESKKDTIDGHANCLIDFILSGLHTSSALVVNSEPHDPSLLPPSPPFLLLSSSNLLRSLFLLNPPAC